MQIKTRREQTPNNHQQHCPSSSDTCLAAAHFCRPGISTGVDLKAVFTFCIFNEIQSEMESQTQYELRAAEDEN